MTPQTLTPAELDAIDAMLPDCNPPECTDAAMYDLNEDETRTARALFALAKAAPALLAMARRLGRLSETITLEGIDVPAVAVIENVVAQLTAATARAEAAEATLRLTALSRDQCLELLREARLGLDHCAAALGIGEWDPHDALNAIMQLRDALAAAKLGGG